MMFTTELSEALLEYCEGCLKSERVFRGNRRPLCMAVLNMLEIEPGCPCKYCLIKPICLTDCKDYEYYKANLIMLFKEAYKDE